MSSTFKRRQQQKQQQQVHAISNESSNNNDNVNTTSKEPVQQQQQQQQQQTKISITTTTTTGCKVWIGGIRIVSTGIKELDTILSGGSNGGGQPFGTCIYINNQDCFSTKLLGNIILKYWCAEAISQEQQLLIPIPNICNKCHTKYNINNKIITSSWRNDDLNSYGSNITYFQMIQIEKYIQNNIFNSLPKNLHLEKKQQQKEEETLLITEENTTTTALLDTLTEEEQEDQYDDDLVVAWQYRKDIQQQRLGIIQVEEQQQKSNIRLTTTTNSKNKLPFCCSYDLHGNLIDQIDNIKQYYHILPIIGCCCCCCNDDDNHNNRNNMKHCAIQYYKQIINEIKRRIIQTTTTNNNNNNNNIIRLVLYNHPNNTSILVIALPLILHKIRQEQLPVVVICVNNNDNNNYNIQKQKHNSIIQRQCDVVLQAESFIGRQQLPLEFQHLHGLLHIKKVSTCTLTSSIGHFANITKQKRPTAYIYGLQRDNRKLHIKLLHIPPEHYSPDGTSVGTNAVRSGAGRHKHYEKKNTTTGGGCGGGSSTLDF